MIPTTNRLF